MSERISLTPLQKLHALAHRFYQFGVWTPKALDYYTTSRADLELYQIVEIDEGLIKTKYCDPTRGGIVSTWDAATFLSKETFGYARVHVPEWLFQGEMSKPTKLAWQPMASAPRDGTPLLLRSSNGSLIEVRSAYVNGRFAWLSPIGGLTLLDDDEVEKHLGWVPVDHLV